MGRLHTLVVLGWALVRTLLAPLLFGRRGRRGLAAFWASYRGDRVPPVTADERRLLFRAGACIACGRCDAGQGAAMVRSQGAFAGVMDLMLASSRSMPDYDAASRSFAAVDDATLAELEGRCPVGVPMRDVAALVRSKAAEIASVTPAPAKGLVTAESP